MKYQFTGAYPGGINDLGAFEPGQVVDTESLTERQQAILQGSNMFKPVPEEVQSAEETEAPKPDRKSAKSK